MTPFQAHPGASPAAKSVELAIFAICVAELAFLAGAFMQGLWLVDADGRGQVADFVNIWAAGQLVLEGHPAAAYDWVLHKSAEDAAIGGASDAYFPWFYPPPFLFVAALLALAPYAVAFVGWLAVTLPAYAIVIRGIVGRRIGFGLACAFPAALANAMVGQNGYVTAALLGGALHLMERRPALSGLLIGLLTYKPHFGLLIPLVLAVAGRWRVIMWAAASGALLAAWSVVAFGWSTWAAFAHSLPLASGAVLTQGRGDFTKMHSAFALIRLLGGSELLAWSLQAAVIVASGALVCVLWRTRAAFELKSAALAAATLLVTPYLYVYDLVVLAVPMAFLIRLGCNGGFLTGEVPAMIGASLLIVIFMAVKAPLGLCAIVIVAALVGRRALIVQPA